MNNIVVNGYSGTINNCLYKMSVNSWTTESLIQLELPNDLLFGSSRKKFASTRLRLFACA